MNKFISLMSVSIKGIIRGKENKKKKLLSHGIILVLAGHTKSSKAKIKKVAFFSPVLD